MRLPFDYLRAVAASKKAQWIGLLVSLLAVGCHPGDFEFRGDAYHSNHFDYLYHPDDRTVCSEVTESLEQHRSLLSSYLSIDPETLPRVTYFKLRNETEYGQRNDESPESAADAGKGFVASPLPFDEHELVHTITLGAWGYSTPFLEEGIAVALSCDPAAAAVGRPPYLGWTPAYDMFPAESSPQSLALDTGTTPFSLDAVYSMNVAGTAAYSAAGAVVTYLLDTGGPGAFRELWGSVSDSTSEHDFSARLKELYGVSLEDVWTTLTTTRHRPCAPVWMCSLPEISAGDQGNFQSSCTGKGLGRPTRGNLRLQFPALTMSAGDVSQDPNAPFVPAVTGISLIPCTGAPSVYLPIDPEAQHRFTRADTWIPALESPHLATVETYAWVIQSLQYSFNSPAGQIAYRMAPLEPTTTRCSEAAANLITAGVTSALFLPADGITRYARFRVDPAEAASEGLDVNLYDTDPTYPPSPDLHAELCTACNGDEAADCNGCPPGTSDCVVRFNNNTGLPLWLRLTPGEEGHTLPAEWGDIDGGTPDASERDSGETP